MGFLAKLFGIHEAPSMPVITTEFPLVAAQRLDNGKLSKLNVPGLVLNTGEICHFADNAAIAVEQKYFNSRRNGASFRVFKGVTWHTGETTSTPQYETAYTVGRLIITNKRVIFLASKNGVDKKLTSITSVNTYTNGIEIQFGNKTHTFILNDGKYASAVLNIILHT